MPASGHSLVPFYVYLSYLYAHILSVSLREGGGITYRNKRGPSTAVDGPRFWFVAVSLCSIRRGAYRSSTGYTGYAPFRLLYGDDFDFDETILGKRLHSHS